MIRRRDGYGLRYIIIIFLIVTVLSGLQASETKDGLIRLFFNEKNGSFSFFYLAGSQTESYEPLLSRHRSATSYLTVNADGRPYQLGKSRAFKVKTGNARNTAANADTSSEVIYESGNLIVKLVFAPVKTSNSPNANGIRISIEITNKSNEKITVGLRMLLDTYLGEGRGRIPFITDNQEITAETIIKSDSGDSYWISKRDGLSLMGNIINPFNEDSKQPDYLHFANWKKMNDVPWKTANNPGRSFNSVPFSIGDSAVCYYYEPDILSPGSSFNYIIYLTAEDTQWYLQRSLQDAAPQTAEEINKTESPAEGMAAADMAEKSMEEDIANNEDSDILTLIKLNEVITQFLAGDILLNEQDLLEIEASINRFNSNR